MKPPTRPSRHLPTMAAASICLGLVIAVLAGAGDAIVWPLGVLSASALGALLYLGRTRPGR